TIRQHSIPRHTQAITTGRSVLTESTRIAHATIANMQSEGILSSHINGDNGSWDAEVDDVLVCRRVLEETHDVKTFLFRGQQPQDFRYLPGQFLTFDFEIDGQTINRCYTISSTPTRPHLISITSKRVPGGPVSNWLHDNLKPGMEVRAVGPLDTGPPGTRLQIGRAHV